MDYTRERAPRTLRPTEKEKEMDRFAEVLRRDAEQRAGADGLRSLVGYRLIAHPTGVIYGGPTLDARGNMGRSGPLDGQPEHRWEWVGEYDDGTRKSFGLESRLRGVPALA